ncbi:L-ascorbate oxidase [Tolypocladium paradoxum]|uniref:L-ascorbate oxidase n=1 Tax=Tolypocladium paradoxum TaxID=94208 RepID=A0A2S4KX96_9HYPO|nr:L-ascorbate oxidase [Tolypocladium paradoxum]
MFPTLPPVLLLLAGVLADLRVHDAAFEPEYVLEATAGSLKIACKTRYSVTLNGTSPGPTLFLKEGQTTWIRVHNRMLDQNITVVSRTANSSGQHWHGLSQRTAPFSDGTPLVSQWPIPPNHFFDYEIKPEYGDAGTYFYHSHVGFQQSTAHGALIVRDAKQPVYKYDDDVLLTVGDYYAKDDGNIEAGLHADPFQWPGQPQAIAIQGHTGEGGFAFDRDPSCAPHVIEVDPGKIYRIRVIGATVISIAKIAIESHPNLEVIEADGSYTKPVVVDHIQVASGQRFSYLLRTRSVDDIRSAQKSQFWIRYESRDRPEVVGGFALLRYRLSECQLPLPSSLPSTSPVTLPQRTNNYLEYSLQANILDPLLNKFPRLSEVTRTVTIQVNQKLTSGGYIDGNPNGSLEWVQNGFSWKEDVQASANMVPYLVDLYRTGQTPNYTRALEHGGFDPISKTFPGKVGEVLDIVWENNAGVWGKFDSHPMHLHGEHAWDLGSGNGTYNALENEARFGSFTPARRDTTVLYRYTEKGLPHTTAGWRAWRIRVTKGNIGAWMMHCHIAQHALMGMNTVWVFGDGASIRQKFPVLPYTQGYLEFGGSAYGNRTRDPVVNHYFRADDSATSDNEQ